MPSAAEAAAAVMQGSTERAGSRGLRPVARSATLKTPPFAHPLLLTPQSGEGLQASSNSTAISSPRGGVGNNAAHFLRPCIPSRREVGDEPPSPSCTHHLLTWVPSFLLFVQPGHSGRQDLRWLGHQQAVNRAAWIERQQHRRRRLGYMRAALGDGAADLAVHEPEVNLCLMLWRLAQQKSTQADLTTAANKEPLAAKFGPFHYVLLAGRVRVFEREACLQSKTMALPRCLHCIQGYIFRGAYWLRFWTQLQQHEA